ncbi:ATPase assembly factor ATP10 [Irpex rosettiformis]|uniref:ATPase assembly factor ATP10 n=1 Tax=Irpex rosettiformis TaxID=378272 RepID=A0ACB8TZF3_9APHY|nr:ATPase assembly factor ATP10 [Irpex rosettiformis]
MHLSLRYQNEASQVVFEHKSPAQEKARDGIPFLAQPLGVAEPPTGKHSRWADIIWDDKLRVKQRGALLKEVVKGNFDDLNATRHHGGKMWIAPPALIRENKARYFPDIEGTSLATSEKTYTTDILLKKVSLVSILSSKISEIQTHMFTEPTCTQYSGDRHFQHLKINLQENKMRSVLVSFFASSIRKTMPKEQWPFYMISSQNMDYIRDDIGLRNKFIGYVFLVDDKCRIRWAGCADPQPAEIQALRTCTGNLLKRLK